ncbi:MAG: hypothetical protein ACOYVK_07500 [Bacillota bacterium]
MEQRNRLNEVPLASVDDQELRNIRELEEKLGDKYYLIAFEKNDMR